MLFARQLLLSWVANALVIGVVAWAFDDVTFHGFGSLLGAAALFGVLNMILKPIMRLATVPLAVITLGLAWFAVSMLMLKLTDVLVGGFAIHGVETLFWATVLAWSVGVAVDVVGWQGRRARSRAAGAGRGRHATS